MPILPRTVSLYLDMLRIGAALAVFLCHAHYLIFPDIYFPLIFNHGREAVAVFFVLSGFVIQYTILRNEICWRDYVMARLIRIFPVAILAISVTFACDRIGQWIAPDFYAHLYQTYTFNSSHSLLTAWRDLSFTNEIWSANNVFGTNEPYWSLGFEVWYYLLFGLFFFVPRPYRLIMCLLAAMICGPKILLYFPIWLLGMVACRQITTGQVRFSVTHSVIMLLSSVAIYLWVWSHLYTSATTMYKSYALEQEAVNAGYFSVIAMATYGTILSLHRLTLNATTFEERYAQAIRWAAGASFTLYLTHQPMLVMAAAIIGSNPPPIVIFLACTTVIIAVLALAELAERRKNMFRSLLRSLNRRVILAEN